MSKPAKRLLKDLQPPSRDVTIAGNMVSIETAHALLTRLGYENIEIADLLETAAFLAGES